MLNLHLPVHKGRVRKGPIGNMSPPRTFRSWLQPSRFSFLLAFLSGTAISQTPSPAPSSSEKEIGLRLLFKFETEEAKLAAIDLAGEEQLDFEIKETKMAVITVPSLEVLQALQALDGIEYAEADSAKSKFPYYGDDRSSPHDDNIINRRLDERQPYGIAMIQADQLWNITPVGEVDVCVVDTGIEDGHEDLPNSVDDGVNGTSTFPLPLVFGTWYQDGDGHGTHCAGIIGAIGNNGKGVVGVRKTPSEFRFHIGQGLSSQGAGFTSTILEAVNGCVQAEAKVISMSLGGPTFSQMEDDYYSYLYSQGFLIIAAAGNAGNSEYSYPASYKAVMSVAAVDADMNIAGFSQFNDQIEIAGPGVKVLSTFPPNTYEFLSGTSMACPYVAGVAAEVWSHFPNCTNNQIRNVLVRTALDRGATGYDVNYGHGIVQAKAAYDLLQSEGCEAGGNVTTVTPLGGCEQNPDYSASQCSAASSTIPLGFSLFLSVTTTWIFLSAS